MGDYVDRGFHSPHTFMYFTCLKFDFPEWIQPRGGNHDCRAISSRCGFSQEILFNYDHSGLWALCSEAFGLLPVVDGRIFCVHGGSRRSCRLSPISQ
jgi:hypothetical protein